jgi:hypothetical protein
MTSSHLVPPRPGRTFGDLVPSSQSYRGTRDEGRTPTTHQNPHLVPGRTRAQQENDSARSLGSEPGCVTS